jgi:two-component system, LytTR family, response regulator
MPDPLHLQCLIVDDEPPARAVLKRYIEEVPMLQLAGECGNALQAIQFLQTQHVDILFLDIRMPQLNGTELLKVIRNPPPVIFTTAHAEYALEGYELDVMDYLLKPVRFDRFVKAVNKVAQLSGQRAIETNAIEEEQKKDSFVYFRADRKMMKVMLDDILFIESMKDYVKVFTSSGTIITKQSITAAEAMLPEKEFIRTHRSFIVSIKKIRSFTSELIEVGKHEIPIGKLYRNGVLKVLQ